VPTDYLDRFRALRGYARRLGDFLVPVLGTDEDIAQQRDFDRVLARLDPAAVATFVERATAYRADVRERSRLSWLDFHDLYEGIPEVLERVADGLYIVTARDERSVQQLLAAHGTAIDPWQIYGSQESKGAALADIAAREGSELYFIDDSLPNVLAAQAEGHRSAWAGWGYSAADHRSEAARLGVPRLTLGDLPAVAMSVTRNQ